MRVSHTEERRENRLARTNSPYLLQHARNPVDWYPWGDEAFERAKREEKPIFLSIGYSSCHWCHVMERLVFENEAVAKHLNEHFVCIKVDREERPDVDRVYMNALLTYFRAMGSKQGGGWPLSLFLTPAGKPILGGTYFPPEQTDGRPGFRDVAEQVVDLWSNKRETVEEFADTLARQVRRSLQPTLVLKPIQLDEDLVDAAVQKSMDGFDDEHGGFGFDEARPDGPKFPVGARLALLQYRARRHGGSDVERALALTLRKMADGGLYDHLGGGFHRYSVDRTWHVPHFEKMLYDQAQLAAAYTEAFRVGGDVRDRETVEGTLDFVLRELRHEGGAFQTSLDAETDGIEGAYYLWSPDDVRALVGADEANLFGLAYGLDGPKSLEHGWVLRRTRTLEKLAAESGETPATLRRQLDAVRRRLLAARMKRRPPRKDDKILTAWNGLAIRAFADAGRVLGREDYVAAAERAAIFVLTRLRNADGDLLRSFRGETAGVPATLNDYAFLVDGLLALHEATRDEKWSNAARRLTDRQIALFGDDRGGGFYFTSEAAGELLVRAKGGFDSAVPSANAVSVRNLIRIASISGEDAYSKRAKRTLNAFAGELERAPGGMSTMAIALGEYLDDPDFGALIEREEHREPDGSSSVEPAIRFDLVDTEPRDVVRVGAETPIDEDGHSGTGSSRVEVAAGESTASPQRKPPEYLAARAILEWDRLPAGRRCRILISMRVREGWHVNANPPQPDYAIPVSVSLKSKYGTTLKDLRYPAGKAVPSEFGDEPAMIYEGLFGVYGVLDIPAEAAGRTEEMQLTIRYQPCSGDRCLRPQTLELKGRLGVARPGEPLRMVNTKYFSERR